MMNLNDCYCRTFISFIFYIFIIFYFIFLYFFNLFYHLFSISSYHFAEKQLDLGSGITRALILGSAVGGFLCRMR